MVLASKYPIPELEEFVRRKFIKIEKSIDELPHFMIINPFMDNSLGKVIKVIDDSVNASLRLTWPISVKGQLSKS